ncbi:hypothetical protein [Oscillatoria sp. FACHB-1406]|nr:hypothetical protein [Oscillatoria sp. FACHB-1406]MBD2579707.1 hypothetical protein [Oscillatoria sp. FACHB-1406]
MDPISAIALLTFSWILVGQISKEQTPESLVKQDTLDSICVDLELRTRE